MRTEKPVGMKCMVYIYKKWIMNQTRASDDATESNNRRKV